MMTNMPADGDRAAAIKMCVANYMREHTLTLDGERLLVAVSGGPDSVALLSILCALKEHLAVSLHVAHLNHMLRGDESEHDADFVRELAAKAGLGCTVGAVDVNERRAREGGSIEAIARDARREFLQDVAAQIGADKIALGHQRDDVAETVVMRLLRGSGSTGLSGLRPKRDGRWIRPLLCLSRDAIVEYLQHESLSYRRDSSNDDTRFLRNRLRHDLLPHLASAYNPAVHAALARTGAILAEEDAYLDAVATEALASVGTDRGIDATALASMPTAIQRRVLRIWLTPFISGRRSPTFREIERTRQFAAERTRRSMTLTRDLRLVHELLQDPADGRLVVQAVPQNTKPDAARSASANVSVPGHTVLEGLELGVSTEVLPRGAVDVATLPNSEAAFDWDALPKPLVLRARRHGDRFQPFGLAGTKRVSAVLSEVGVPSWRRDGVSILCGGDAVLWVVGVRADGRYCVRSSTSRLLHVRSFRSPVRGPGDGPEAR